MTDFNKLCEWMGWTASSIERREGVWRNDEPYEDSVYFAIRGQLTPAGAVAVLERALLPYLDRIERSAAYPAEPSCPICIRLLIDGKIAFFSGNLCTAVLDAALAGNALEQG